MKQFLVAFAIISFVYTTTKAQSNIFLQPKLSASAKQFLWLTKKQNPESPSPINGFAYKLDDQNTIFVSVFIKVFPGFNDAELKSIGVNVGTKAGNIWTLQVPLNKINSLTHITGIQYIDMDQPACKLLDSARIVTRTDSVQKGYGLPQGYSGKNVVVGVVDGGFDYDHPTFYDTSYNRYRIKRVWEEKNTKGPHPAGFSYGTEFTDSASILTEKMDEGGFHGTHVAGIAAGSGYGSSKKENRFRGMAYGSDIVFVGINPDNSAWLGSSLTDMLDGINYCVQYAASVSKPVVVNLSWGNPMGPHDGTSLFSQGCDNLLGPGKIFVISAGNESGDTLHFQKTFSSADTIVNTFLTFSPNLSIKTNVVDFWGDSAKPFCIKFTLYDSLTQKLDSTSFICLDDTTHQFALIGSNKDTCLITLSTVASEFNGEPHMQLQVTSKVKDNLCLTLKSTNSTINAWQGYVTGGEGYYGKFVKLGQSWATNGDNLMTISDMTTTKSAITVGAFASKRSFVNVSLQALQYPGVASGKIASFSSMGPTADGRIEPNISGPGLGVASSISAYDSSFYAGKGSYNLVIAKFVSPLNGNTYSYAIEQGTSMSSPAVAGIVALLLEANPKLTPQDVKDVLDSTAIIDKYTGTIPAGGNNIWGFGKVNAYRAIKKVLQNVGIYHLSTSTLNCLLYPNPTNGDYAIDYISDCDEVLSLSVINISGKQLLKQTWQVKTGDNKQDFNLSAYPAGIYIAQLAGKNGNATIKIVKQ